MVSLIMGRLEGYRRHPHSRVVDQIARSENLAAMSAAPGDRG
jgi:hypothetical protein